MLDIRFISENPQIVKKACADKNISVDVDKFLELDKQTRGFQLEIENLRAQKNKLGKATAEGGVPSEVVKDQGRELKEKLKGLEESFNATDQERAVLHRKMPNIPFDDVPVGKDDSQNVVLKKVGKLPEFTFSVKDHVQIGHDLNLIDNETASNMAGARFTYLKNELALLQFALIQYAFSVLTSEKNIKKIADSVKRGFNAKVFSPTIVPVMIKPDVFSKMARLEPKEERYYIPNDDLYLIGSAEHALAPMHMNEIILESSLPLRYVGYSTSFRREAGSYGKDTKGILRMHQFDKVEMETFSKPEDSTLEQDFLVAIQEYLMKSLEIPYQVVMVCTGDMGGPDARQIDIECWMPGQNKYRETHSADLNTDYQSRGLNTKLKRRNGETEFVHMNDATVFAIGRTLIAILENGQQKDGSVKIPKVLQKYTGFKVIK